MCIKKSRHTDQQRESGSKGITIYVSQGEGTGKFGRGLREKEDAEGEAGERKKNEKRRGRTTKPKKTRSESMRGLRLRHFPIKQARTGEYTMGEKHGKKSRRNTQRCTTAIKTQPAYTLKPQITTLWGRL